VSWPGQRLERPRRGRRNALGRQQQRRRRQTGADAYALFRHLRRRLPHAAGPLHRQRPDLGRSRADDRRETHRGQRRRFMSAHARLWLWLQLALAWLPMWALFTAMIVIAHGLPWHGAMLGALRMVVPGALLGVAVYRFAVRTPWPHPFRLTFLG